MIFMRPPQNGISIHALRVEGDEDAPAEEREAYISIHALRVEGDAVEITPRWRALYFYPRPPGGGRRQFALIVHPCVLVFLSTPSGWRATSVQEASECTS